VEPLPLIAVTNAMPSLTFTVALSADAEIEKFAPRKAVMVEQGPEGQFTFTTVPQLPL
jgi:hypothetical protein